MVLKVDLDHFIAEPEHDSMSGSHPLLDIHYICYLSLRKLIFGLRIGLRLFAALQIASKVLEKSNLFLEFLRVLCEGVLFAYVLSVTASSFIIVKMITIRVKNDFG
jgi:hypothetical protein